MQVHGCCKKKTQRHNLTYFRLASKYLHFLVVTTSSLQESLTATYCINLFFTTKFSERCLSYVKTYFQPHRLSSYFLMPIWERKRESSRVRVLKQNISENIFPLKDSSMYLFSVKKYFQLHKWSFSFFMLQNTWTFSLFASAGLRKIKDLGTKEF